MVEVVRRSTFTRSQEDYLKALYQLHGDQRPVPTGDLAQRLGISSPSVSEMVAKLTAQGLVEHDRYRGQQLTREGRKVALELVRHHRLLEMFLVQVLGYHLDEVHVRALEAYGAAGLGLGGTELPAARDAGRSLVALAPLRESGHRLLMRTLAAEGNVAEALRAYEHLRRLLADELGIDPRLPSRQLYQHLLESRE